MIPRIPLVLSDNRRDRRHRAPRMTWQAAPAILPVSSLRNYLDSSRDDRDQAGLDHTIRALNCWASQRWHPPMSYQAGDVPAVLLGRMTQRGVGRQFRWRWKPS